MLTRVRFSFRQKDLRVLEGPRGMERLGFPRGNPARSKRAGNLGEPSGNLRISKRGTLDLGKTRSGGGGHSSQCICGLSGGPTPYLKSKGPQGSLLLFIVDSKISEKCKTVIQNSNTELELQQSVFIRSSDLRRTYANYPKNRLKNNFQNGYRQDFQKTVKII